MDWKYRKILARRYPGNYLDRYLPLDLLYFEHVDDEPTRVWKFGDKFTGVSIRKPRFFLNVFHAFGRSQNPASNCPKLGKEEKIEQPYVLQYFPVSSMFLMESQILYSSIELTNSRLSRGGCNEKTLLLFRSYTHHAGKLEFIASDFSIFITD